ncbi:serine hydrolase [Streptomyces mashuensis]|uniref:Serine hydrolase n=1 Tax=Streptomyces mashuensis TaxID=33904 RepID=A0A919B4B1_9ACTN|nr:serine hydrolase domain-containing protein [Streptomyces mashuensis]GHF45722.1 serine hydrolase [Streptomyces mashuensis]
MRHLLAVLAVVTALTVTAAAGPGSRPEPRAGRALQAALDRVVADGAVGATATVREGRRTMRLRAGAATLDGGQPGSARAPAPVPLRGRFRIGSVTKTFVATVLLQLAAEGRLGLDDPVRRHLPGLLPPDKDAVTVRMLLHHSSGLPSYVSAIPAEGAAFLRNRYRHYDARDLVARVADAPLLFPPGSRWSYSDTNYIVAGLLVTAVTGRTWNAEVTDRIVRPLGLRATSAPEDDPRLPGPHAHGYFRASPDAAPVDISELNPSLAGAAGAMISSADDLDRFLTALVGGRLLPPAQTAELLRSDAAAQGYGLGIHRFRTSCGIDALGHNGEIHGYFTLAVTTPDRTRRVVASVTTRAFPLAAGQPLAASLGSMLEAALCG